MRILIDASTANMGGALNYITQLLQEIQLTAKGHQCFVLLPPQTSESLHTSMGWYRGPLQEDGPSIQLLDYTPRGKGPLKYLYDHLYLIPKLAKQCRADILFSSTGFGTWWSPCPELLLIRNAAYFCPLYQEHGSKQGRAFWSLLPRRWLSLFSIRMADFILFPSDAIRKEVACYIPLHNKRTDVLHYGFAHKSFREETSPPPILEQIKTWKSEGYKILLHVSSYAIHKNMEVVLEALPELCRMGIKFKWVTTLSREKTGHKALYDTFFQRAQQLGLSEHLETSGHIHHKQLHALYQSADVFVFPSFTESFGQPLVEAMASGLPVVASDRPVHRELGEDAFLYFETFDPASCASMLAQVLQDSELANDLGQRSLQRSKQFSWQKYTREILKKLQDVANTLPTS